MKSPRPSRISSGRGARNRGFSLLETQVAFLLLGLSLAGLIPMVALQLRMSRLIARAHPKANEAPIATATPMLWPDATFYLTPPVFTQTGDSSSIDAQKSKWVRKLGASASLTTADSPFSDDQLQTANDPVGQSGVRITQAPVRSTVDDSVTVHVIVIP